MSMVTLSLTATRTRRVPHWSELRKVFLDWRQRTRSRRELMTLSDRDLSDIGLTRMDAHSEGSKPFLES
jgi:uncharacterized protein YjiS (DUF1127 family)